MRANISLDAGLLEAIDEEAGAPRLDQVGVLHQRRAGEGIQAQYDIETVRQGINGDIAAIKPRKVA